MNLRRVYARFFAESDWLLAQFDDALTQELGARTDGDHTRARRWRSEREMCIIRVQDAWARFTRELIVVSAFDRPVTVGGTVVPRTGGFRTRRDVVGAIQQKYRSSLGNEPPWHVPTDALMAAQWLGIGNRAAVAAGLGATPSPLDHIRALRNFIAHRSPHALARVQAVAGALTIPVTTEAVDIAGELSPGGVTWFRAWVLELRRMAWASVQ